MDSDRTPADVIALLNDIVGQEDDPYFGGGRGVADALTAAGYRVTPIPDDNTRAPDKFDVQKVLDQALQDAWDDYVGDTHCHPPDFTVEGGRSSYTLSASFRSNWTLYAAERLAQWVAALLDGQPQDRPAQCPNCRSKRPGFYPAMFRNPPCAHSWHGGGSEVTR